MESELLGQQSINKYLMSSYYVQRSVLDVLSLSFCYIPPPKLLPVTLPHLSLLCLNRPSSQAPQDQSGHPIITSCIPLREEILSFLHLL